MIVRKALLAPLWLLQLATGAKSFLDNPFIGSNRLNRCGLHVARVKIADAMCRWRRSRLAKKVPSDWRESFDRDGYVAIPNIVPAEEFARLREALLNYRGTAREMLQGDAITRRMAVDPQMLRTVPELRSLLERKDILALFHYVMSYSITPLHYIQTIVSKAGGKEPDPQETLHADSFHASLKAWLFLRPVGIEDGPFTYVPGSHLFTRERIEWERTRSLANPREIDRLSARGSPRVCGQDLDEMELPPPHPIAVDANTLVVADTVGFHARSPSVRSGERVELWSYGRRNPFLPWLGGDPTSLPGIAERRVSFVWWVRDRFDKQFGQPWRPVGQRTPIDR
jgi:Phytanoyl-CoA dioxygenase (PhyH)